jgi:hypothetical protein
MSSLLVAGGLALGGCLPTEDLADYSEQWSNAFGGSGGSGGLESMENDGLGGEVSAGGTQGSDGGPIVVDINQGASAGTSSGGAGDAELDAGATGVADATDAAALADACADAAPGSLGCGT